MSTSTKAHNSEEARRQKVNRMRREQASKDTRRRSLTLGAWIVAVGVITAVVAAMLLTSRPASSDSAKAAAGFTLTDTAGAQINLADYRGKNVLLFFNEGAGCQACLVQIAEIEKYTKELTDLDLTVLPIVMNTREQITADMQANGVDTPFLLDDGTVSRAYDTLGKGMHPELPGHSFVLIDAEGTQRWYGEYPSMWLAPQDLFKQVRQKLAA